MIEYVSAIVFLLTIHTSQSKTVNWQQKPEVSFPPLVPSMFVEQTK